MKKKSILERRLGSRPTSTTGQPYVPRLSSEGRQQLLVFGMAPSMWQTCAPQWTRSPCSDTISS